MKKIYLLLLLVVVTTTAIAQNMIGTDKETVVSTLKSNGGTFVKRIENKDGSCTLSYTYPNGSGLYLFSSDDECIMSMEAQKYSTSNYEAICENMDKEYERLENAKGMIVWVIPNEDDDIYYCLNVNKEIGMLGVSQLNQSLYEKNNIGGKDNEARVKIQPRSAYQNNGTQNKIDTQYKKTQNLTIDLVPGASYIAKKYFLEDTKKTLKYKIDKAERNYKAAPSSSQYPYQWELDRLNRENNENNMKLLDLEQMKMRGEIK